jgi:hypothetical protein
VKVVSSWLHPLQEKTDAFQNAADGGIRVKVVSSWLRPLQEKSDAQTSSGQLT